MSAYLPTIKQLRYLVALADLGHFRKAAEACFVSQSAFSVAIQELENLLKLQLVDRTNRSVTITAIGQDVVSQARLVLRDMEMLVDIAQGEQQPLAGRLQLGVIPTIAPFLLPNVVPKLRKQYPKLKLFLKEDMTARIYDELMEGKLDVIIIALPYELKNVETHVLFKDQFYLAYHQGTKQVDPENYNFKLLQHGSVLLLEDGHCLRDHALSASKVRQADMLNQFSASSLYTLIQMVDNDLGVTFIPEMAVKSDLLKGTKVRTLPLKASSYREIALVWRRGSARQKEFHALGELIRESH